MKEELVMSLTDGIIESTKQMCTAYGFLDHSLKEDCATIQSH